MSEEEIEITLAKGLPSWVATALYAFVFGVALAFNVYVQDHWLTYTLTGYAFAITYLFVRFYRLWAELHNYNTFKQLATKLAEIVDPKLDGTFDPETGLTKEGSDEETDTSTDRE